MGYPGVSFRCSGLLTAGPPSEITRTVQGSESVSARSTASTPAAGRAHTGFSSPLSRRRWRARRAKLSNGYRGGTSTGSTQACPRSVR